jgi:predicted alpha/beta hydrolase family esterase
MMAEMATSPSDAVCVLNLPGLWNSGDAHWQSHWERAYGYRRVLQRDWETPVRDEWVATLEAAVAGTPGPLVLTAHSLGCTLVGYWAQATAHAARVRGALLVAPSDVEAPSYPSGTTGFLPMPRARLPFPAVVVASTDDPYVSMARAADFAAAWGARLVDAGAHGHLNSDSKLGLWPAGHALLAGWLR